MILRYELVSLVISDQIWTEQSHLFQKPKRNTMLKGVSALLQDYTRKNPDYHVMANNCFQLTDAVVAFLR